MPESRLTAPQVLDREFLELRAKILELAASFDRMQRSSDAEHVDQDPRVQKLREALRIVEASQNDPNRAEQVQLLFSRDYHPDWRQSYQLG